MDRMRRLSTDANTGGPKSVLSSADGSSPSHSLGWPSPLESMEAIVVGGGIVGLASAATLIDAGVDVTVLEKSHLGAGATGLGGGVRTQFSTRANVQLSLASLDVWRTFESEYGVDIRPRQLGYLLLAREDATAEELRADIEMQRELGAPNEYRSAAEATAVCPGLEADRFVGAGYSPEDLFVDANLALQGYAEYVREHGGEIRTGSEVSDVRRDDDGRVAGVRTADGETLDAAVVVNAAGAWAAEVAALAGIELPVVPQLRRQLLVEPGKPYPSPHPLTMDLDSGFVFYPEDERSMIVSGQLGPMLEVDPDGYRTNIDLEWTATVLEGVGELADYFGPDTETRERIAGVYATTPDHNPIIEEPVPGFVTAVGFSGHGFMHAPATGRMVAEIVTEGEQSLVDPDAFSSDRFDAGAGDERAFI